MSQVLSVTKAHLATAQREANQKASYYEFEINNLDDKIYQVKSTYEQQYSTLSRRHEAGHGHMITPKYEQDINNLEQWKTKKVKPLEDRIAMLTKQMENDGDLKDLQKKIDSLDGLVKSWNERLQLNEKEVNDIRRQVGVIEAAMNEELKQSSDKSELMEQRKKLALNPCN